MKTGESSGESRLIPIAAIAALAAALGFVTIFSYQCGWQWIDSDHSSEMVLGKLLAEENAFVSSSWLYSTELRIVYQTVFTMPLFKLLGRHENWALIRALNILLNNIVLILSYVFLMKSMKIRAKWILISSLFLLMPLSVTYWNIVTFGGYYVFFIAQLFLCLGLFVAAARPDSGQKTRRNYFILFLMVSFALGAQTVRSLLAVHIPLLLACVCMGHGKKKFPLFPAGYGFAACCAGYGVNWLLHFGYSFKSFTNLRIDDLFTYFFPKLGRCLATVAAFFGVYARSPVFSVRGFFSIAAAALTFILLLLTFKLFRLRKSREYMFMPVFFAVSLLFNIFVFVIVNQPIIDRFFIPLLILYIPLAAILFAHAEKSCGSLKSRALVCGIALFVIGQGCLTFQSLASADANSGRKGYIHYLLDNKLDYGFATHWNANVTTELSNGRIELAGLDARIISGTNTNPFRMLDSLIPQKFFDPFYHRGESFLLLSREEWDTVRRRRSFSALAPDYEDKQFIIIRYPSAETIHREAL